MFVEAAVTSRVRDIHGETFDIRHELIVIKIKNGNDCSVAGSVHSRPASPLYLVSTRPRSTRMGGKKNNP